MTYRIRTHETPDTDSRKPQKNQHSPQTETQPARYYQTKGDRSNMSPVTSTEPCNTAP